MAEVPQIIVETDPASDKPLGARHELNLQQIFAGSPLPGYKAEITDTERRETFQSTVLDGTVSSGFGFTSFTMDYSNAPDLDSVATGGGGLPATPYTPNPVSPGPGVTTAGAIPAYEGEIPDSGPEYGSGLGGTANPATTSTQIAGQTLGEYILGDVAGYSKSYEGSTG